MTHQRIHLAIWKPSNRSRWLLLEHERLRTPGGDFCLAGDLSLYIPPGLLPPEPGLHVCDVTVSFYENPGFGTDCRLNLHATRQIVGGISGLFVV